jgi:hypothetical protein
MSKLSVYSVETFTTSKGVERTTISFSTKVSNKLFTTEQPYGRLVVSETSLKPGDTIDIADLGEHTLVSKDYETSEGKPFSVNWIKLGA